MTGPERILHEVSELGDGNDVPTIRELIEWKAELGLRHRRAERALHETITLSDKSPCLRAAEPARRGYNSRQRFSRSTATIGKNSGQEPSLQEAFRNLIPSNPYCADNLSDGLQIRSRSSALQKRFIQLNGPSTFQWMVHDLDIPGAYFAHDDANLPPPNVIMINPDNGHAHACYLLDTPVARHHAARDKPLRFFAACERGVGRRLGADRAYAGLIAKNPLHPAWHVEWRRESPYSLTEIEGHLFERDMRFEPSVASSFGAGRNVMIFEELRAIAYREVRKFQEQIGFDAWHNRCMTLALALNLQFPKALPLSEIRAIAKSVARWTWKHFSADKFSARQSYLGKRGMASRWRGHVRTEPWKALGISKATFYRRKSRPD